MYTEKELVQSHLCLVVSEHIVQSRLQRPRPAPWTSACGQRSTDQTQPSAEWQSLPPADDDTSQEWLNTQRVNKRSRSLIHSMSFQLSKQTTFK